MAGGSAQDTADGASLATIITTACTPGQNVHERLDALIQPSALQVTILAAWAASTYILPSRC